VISLAERYQQEIVNFDREAQTNRICECMRAIMRNKLHRRGVVVVVSGSIDTALSAALAVRAQDQKKGPYSRTTRSGFRRGHPPHKAPSRAQHLAPTR